MSFFLGIDGGGTKTRCLIGDEKSVLGTGASTSSKVQRVGEACAHDAVAAAIHEACVQAGVSPRQIARTCAGVTGAARPEIANTMRRLLAGIVGGEIEVIGDFEIAFEDAFGGGPGVLVISGTGSIAYGRNAAGETARAGGWGHAISDEGSGYWLGLKAVQNALRTYDESGAGTLLKRLMETTGATSFDDFIVKLNAEAPPDYSALFPLVQECADAGEPSAIAVLTAAGLELADLAKIALRRLQTETHSGAHELSVATHGGVFANSAQIRKSFQENLRREFAEINLVSRAVNPARGAVQRAGRAPG